MIFFIHPRTPSVSIKSLHLSNKRDPPFIFSDGQGVDPLKLIVFAEVGAVVNSANYIDIQIKKIEMTGSFENLNGTINEDIKVYGVVDGTVVKKMQDTIITMVKKN